MPYLKKKRYGGFSKRGTYSKKSNKTWKKKSTYKRKKPISKFRRSQLRFKKLLKPTIIKSPPSGGSNSRMVVKYSKSSMGKYAQFSTQPSTYEFCGAGSMVSKMSGQEVSFITGGYIGEGIGSTVDFYNLFQQMTIKDNSSSSLAEGLNADGNASYKVWLDSEIRESVFTNFSPMPITLTIWNWVANSDQDLQGAGPGYSWTSPLDAWNKGLLQSVGGTLNQDGGYGGTVPGWPTCNFPGADPRDSKLFNIYFKIQRKTMVTLGPGRSHRHIYVFKPQTLIDTNRFAQPRVVAKGLTNGAMYAIIGGLSSSQNTGITDTTTFGIAKVGIITKYKWVSRLVSILPRNNFQDNNVSTTAGNNYIQRENSGAVSAKVTDANFG